MATANLCYRRTSTALESPPSACRNGIRVSAFRAIEIHSQQRSPRPRLLCGGSLGEEHSRVSSDGQSPSPLARVTHHTEMSNEKSQESSTWPRWSVRASLPVPSEQCCARESSSFEHVEHSEETEFSEVWGAPTHPHTHVVIFYSRHTTHTHNAPTHTGVSGMQPPSKLPDIKWERGSASEHHAVVCGWALIQQSAWRVARGELFFTPSHAAGQYGAPTRHGWAQAQASKREQQKQHALSTVYNYLTVPTRGLRERASPRTMTTDNIHPSTIVPRLARSTYQISARKVWPSHP